jgi:hypothetical protein
MKSYYRYEPERALGVITASDCNAIFDSTGKLAFTGSLQNVGVWNLRQASQVSLFIVKKFTLWPNMMNI